MRVFFVVTCLTIVLASKQFGFADFRFTGSFQQAHPLLPGSLQHWVGFVDSFALDQVSLGVNEGRLGFCRAANVALTFLFVSRAESRWIVELFSTALADFGLASGSFEIRDSVLEFAHLVVI